MKIIQEPALNIERPGIAWTFVLALVYVVGLVIIVCIHFLLATRDWLHDIRRKFFPAK